MSIYDPLYNYLKNAGPIVTLTFDDLKNMLGEDLQLSAKIHREWLSNDDFSKKCTHSM